MEQSRTAEPGVDEIERTNETENVEGAALLDEEEAARARSRWQSIQGSFIDEPRETVAEADSLVSELVDRITKGFERQRGELESAWERGEEVSTEDLRLTLQKYRTFFERLLSL